MDKKDRILLYELSKNSRVSVKYLAKQLKLNVSSVSHRLKRLIDDKIIINFYPIIDSNRIGLKGFKFYFKFFGTTPEKEAEIIDWLNNQKDIHVVGIDSGSVDVSILTWLENEFLFHELISRFKEKYRRFITSLDSFIYLRVYQFNRAYLIDSDRENSDYVMIGSDYSIKIDDLDKSILLSLTKNARKSFLDISAELNVPVRTVAFRLKRLEKNKIILGYSINIDLTKLSYEYYKINFIFNENIKFSSLLEFANSLKNTRFVDVSIGKYDFELNVEVKDRKEVLEIIQKIKQKFGGLKSYNFFQVIRYTKLRFI